MKKHWRTKNEVREVGELVRAIRKSGVTGKLAIVLEEELVDNRNWLAKRDWENQLMQQCIFGMRIGKSPCEWCEDYNECKDKSPDKRPEGFGECAGCEDWFLRFLTEEEEAACEVRASGRAAIQKGAVLGETCGEHQLQGES